MKISIIASTKPGYELSKIEAVDFSGKSAGICYMPDTIEELFSEDSEKTAKRAKRTIISGHHSVYDHPTYNLVLEEIPKIIAIILNNEGVYTTSEKSARYTIMKPSEEEESLYKKWIEIYKKVISGLYPKMEEAKIAKLAQENARYLISVFTPATTMEYTVSLRQINYICNWFKDYIENEEDNEFNKLLKPYLQNFIDIIPDVIVDGLNSEEKERKISLFDDRKNRLEEFGECYSTNYDATFAQYAQAHRHRTLRYKMKLYDRPKYYVPLCIKDTEYEEEWIKDISSLAKYYPQGMLVKVNERGTAEDFILKCKERLCGNAQLEITLQTSEILKKYIKNTENTNTDIYEYLLNYSKGARCTFPGYKCATPCAWGNRDALTRKI